MFIRWHVPWDIITVIPLSTHSAMYQRCSFVDTFREALQQYHHCQHISPCIRDVPILTSCVRHNNSNTTVTTSNHVPEMFNSWQVVWGITTVQCKRILSCIRKVHSLTGCVSHCYCNITVNTSHHVSAMFKCWPVMWDITTGIPLSTHLIMYQRCPNVD